MSDLTRAAIEEKLDAVKRKDHYGLLGVKRAAQAGEIKAAYFNLIKAYHPDRVRDPALAPLALQVFRELTVAQATLSDPAKRSAYDKGVPAAPPQRNVVTGPNADQELEQLLDKAAESFGDQRGYMARVFHLRGAALFSKGDLDGAERYMRKALTLDDTVADYHLKLGFTILSNRRLPEEERFGGSRAPLERAIAMNPYSADARYTMALYWKAAGSRDQYRRELEAALRCPGGHAKAEFELNAILRAEARGSGITAAQGKSDITAARGKSDVTPGRGKSDITPGRGKSDVTPGRSKSDITDERPDSPPEKKGFSFARLFGLK